MRAQCARRAAVPKAELAMGVIQRAAIHTQHKLTAGTGARIGVSVSYFSISYGEASNLTVQSTLYKREPRRQRDHIIPYYYFLYYADTAVTMPTPTPSLSAPPLLSRKTKVAPLIRNSAACRNLSRSRALPPS